MSALRVEFFFDEEASNWHFRVPALHINGGGAATRADAERESLAGYRFRSVTRRAMTVRTDDAPPRPFDLDSAITKVQAAEDAWNTRDPHRVSLAYTEDSVWRNRDLFLSGRAEIVGFLTAKWERELDYVLRKSLWGFRENRIAVRFQYEWHDADSDSTKVQGARRRLGMRRAKPASTTCRSAAAALFRSEDSDDERGPGHDIPLR